MIQELQSELEIECERNEDLTDQIEKLISDLENKDAAIQVSHHGASIAKVLAEVKAKVNASISHKFNKYKHHIEDL